MSDTMVAAAEEMATQNISKVDRYEWKVKDQPGKMLSIDKRKLKMHPDYQRQSNDAKVLSMASSWSWVACGSITVGSRGGEYWVIDGQHRVLAARRRSDITSLPCLVFITENVQQEAKGFLSVNTLRKSVSSIDRFRALLASGDKTAIYVDEIFSELGIKPKSSGAKSPLEIASVGWSLARAAENRQAFEDVVRLAADMCRDLSPLHERLLAGLHYMHTCSPERRLSDRKFKERLKKVGPARLVEGATRASAYFARGGAKVWAQGMLDEINKGLHSKFEIPTLTA